MNQFSQSPRRFQTLRTVALVATSTFASIATHAAPALLDDFSDAQRTTGGSERILVNDKELGSQSQGTQSCDNGVLTVQGTLNPGRGVPAFMSLVLLATPDGKPLDLTAFEGVRVRVKLKQGILSVQVGTSEVTNFDYHSTPIQGKAGEFQEIRVPFKTMKRAWSEQTALNLQTVTSINFVAFGMAKGDFAYELDEVGFY